MLQDFLALFGALRQSAVGVEDAVSVEMEDVHGRLGFVFEPLDEAIYGGGAEEFPGEAAGRVALQGIEDGLGVGAGVQETGAFGPADDEKQVEAVLGLGLERGAASRGARDAAADADARGFVEEERAARRGVVEQFPGQREDGGVLGGDGEQAGFVFAVLEGV